MLADQGLDQGVLYFDDEAIPWSGLIEVVEKDSTEFVIDQYVDGVRSVVLQNLGEYSAQIQCFTYPDRLDSNERVGFSYRTVSERNHKTHLIYNSIFIEPDKAYGTLYDSPDLITFQWDLESIPVPLPGSRPVSHLVLDSYENPSVTKTIEDILYGTENSSPRLPTPQEVIDICESVAVLRITYNNDGTWSATGPEDMVKQEADGIFELSAPSVHPLGSDEFIASTY